MPMLTAFDVYAHFFPKRVTPSKALLRLIMQTWRDRHVANGDQGYSDVPAESLTPLSAYVNHGRWLVDCPTCGNGPMVTPREDNPEAPCFVCGTIWTRIRFPADALDIEGELLLRISRRNQNWEPGETVAELRDENIRNRVDITPPQHRTR